MSKRGYAIYHRIMKHENFEKAANDLVNLVSIAEKKHPGEPRILYLDIEGHRNKNGGFDDDMIEIQQKFGIEFLLPFFTEVHFPLIEVKNSGVQRNDVPDGLEILNSNDEKDHALEDLYILNHTNTEYQLEKEIYTFLRKVSRFLERYQKLENQLIFSSEPYDPHNLLLRWRNHINELNIELFNSFISGNLYSCAAMTRTLMECYCYVCILKREKNPKLFEDWYLCGLFQSILKWNEKFRDVGIFEIKELCREWHRDFEETAKRFNKNNPNVWLNSLFSNKNRVGFYQICEYLDEMDLYKDYQWACSFVHGQDIKSKIAPFLFYDSIYYQLKIMMQYIFKSIRIFSDSQELENEILDLEFELLNLYGIK